MYNGYCLCRLLWLIHVNAVALLEILAGSILFEGNRDLCFINTILWPDVVTHKRSNISIQLKDPSMPAAKCNCHCLLIYFLLLI